MNKRLLQVVFVCLFGVGLAHAGIQWTAEVVSTGKQGTTTSRMQGYAQGGMVREEYVAVDGSGNPLTKEGGYWIYNGTNNTVSIVDPEEKTYIVMSIDSLANMMGTLGSIIKVTIKNPSVEVTQLAAETIATHPCAHLKIRSAYDVETKVVIVTAKSHTEENRELWGTNAFPMEEVAFGFYQKSFQTGMADLDALIKEEMKAVANLGFIMKSVTQTTTSDDKGKVSDESNSTMTVTSIGSQDIDPVLFAIPEDYQRVNLSLIPPGK